MVVRSTGTALPQRPQRLQVVSTTSSGAVVRPLVYLGFVLGLLYSVDVPRRWAILSAVLICIVFADVLVAALRRDRFKMLGPLGIPLVLILLPTALPLANATLGTATARLADAEVVSTAIQPVTLFLAGYLITHVIPRSRARTTIDRRPMTFYHHEAVLLAVAALVMALNAATSRGNVYGQGQLDGSTLSGVLTVFQSWVAVGSVRLFASLGGRKRSQWLAHERIALAASAFACLAAMVTGGRRLALVIALALGVSIIGSWQKQRFAIRNSLRVVILSIVGLMLLLTLSTAIRSSRGGANFALPDLSQTPQELASDYETSLWITSRISDLVDRGETRGFALLRADLFLALPPPVDDILSAGSEVKSGAIEFRKAIGFNNPNQGIGMSLVGESIWIGGRLGPLVLGLMGGFLIRRAVRAQGHLVPGTLAVLVVVHLPYIMRSDLVTVFALAVQWAIWSAASLLIRSLRRARS